MELTPVTDAEAEVWILQIKSSTAILGLYVYILWGFSLRWSPPQSQHTEWHNMPPAVCKPMKINTCIKEDWSKENKKIFLWIHTSTIENKPNFPIRQILLYLSKSLIFTYKRKYKYTYERRSADAAYSSMCFRKLFSLICCRNCTETWSRKLD
jgi:hypothetical protein